MCARWATGVAVVTGTGADGEPLGLVVNSFTSLSLDPPLVLFCPGHGSVSWRGMRGCGRFAINVLSGDQAALVPVFARSGGDKFAGVPVQDSADRLPALDGVIARLVCEVEAVYPGGDHEIVVGRVVAAETPDAAAPLLHYRGRAFGLSA
ncbi:flavin reductase family protein [Amycolatopsis alkalitolerans]|uniref:Flavin reductase family protein n=1 Tax=Amycolatopsis alkalitolerans TaxID=2547244 RepID=A0A5C4M2T2_9PSEU|nr:flavin reductase family protein [Amycolatopsis alkalitolerans]